MLEDGFYLSHGPDGRALVIVRQDGGAVLSVRSFANVDFALNVLEEDVLSGYQRNSIEEEVRGRKGLYLSQIKVPQDGLEGAAFARYTRAPK